MPSRLPARYQDSLRLSACLGRGRRGAARPRSRGPGIGGPSLLLSSLAHRRLLGVTVLAAYRKAADGLGPRFASDGGSVLSSSVALSGSLGAFVPCARVASVLVCKYHATNVALLKLCNITQHNWSNDLQGVDRGDCRRGSC